MSLYWERGKFLRDLVRIWTTMEYKLKNMLIKSNSCMSRVEIFSNYVSSTKIYIGTVSDVFLGDRIPQGREGKGWSDNLYRTVCGSPSFGRSRINIRWLISFRADQGVAFLEFSANCPFAHPLVRTFSHSRHPSPLSRHIISAGGVPTISTFCTVPIYYIYNMWAPWGDYWPDWTG